MLSVIARLAIDPRFRAVASRSAKVIGVRGLPVRPPTDPDPRRGRPPRPTTPEARRRRSCRPASSQRSPGFRRAGRHRRRVPGGGGAQFRRAVPANGARSRGPMPASTRARRVLGGSRPQLADSRFAARRRTVIYGIAHPAATPDVVYTRRKGQVHRERRRAGRASGWIPALGSRFRETSDPRSPEGGVTVGRRAAAACDIAGAAQSNRGRREAVRKAGQNPQRTTARARPPLDVTARCSVGRSGWTASGGA